MQSSDIHLETLTGANLLPVLPALAHLRITVFREWPYLYDGDNAYEATYLRRYAATPNAAVVVAWAGGAPVGASTCLPMANEIDDISKPFRGGPLPLSDIFYFGESVLLPAWRGQGLGVAFFAAREAHARACGARLAAFCAIQRNPADPRRPDKAPDLMPFWRNRGYSPHPNLHCILHWKEPGQFKETAHTLTFWLKNL